MKRYIVIATLMVAGMVQADVVQNFQIGGQSENRNTGWSSGTAVGSTSTYVLTDDVDTDLVFTITAVAGNGDAIVLGSNFLSVDSSARQTDTHASRLTDDETVTVTVSYVDPNGSLTSLKVKEFGAFWGNGGTETTVFTVGVTSTNLVAFNHNDPETLIDYSTTTLTALTKDNTGTWSMIASADHTLGVTQSGFGGFELEYTVIPEPATLGLVAMVGIGLIAVRRTFML